MQTITKSSFDTQHTALMAGIALGFLCSVFLLAGDQYGQVNILILLGLFVGVPVLGALLSILPLTLKEPLVIEQLKTRFVFLLGKSPVGVDDKVRKLVVLYHGQYAGVGLAVGSILALLLLLVFTDMHFVWRSTLLTPEVLLPLLEFIALPWYFWESAQPTMALLASSQDSRLLVHTGEAMPFSDWWPFIMACQLCYALLLRILMMGYLRLRIKNAVAKPNLRANVGPTEQMQASSSKWTKTLPHEFTVVNWAGFSASVLEQLSPRLQQQPVINAGPLADETTSLSKDNINLLVLVKAWEPPLEELKDYLDGNAGLICPVELQSDVIAPPKPQHLDEWQRFVATTPQWTLYVGDLHS
ncbi:DUF2868 domain-containing protein [Planctobacterium marinum]|uniref:DUF2868 domain-containing protein n=1 Tax=Planctobacterium marinum TaxID=1631968 RepID=UPI001E350483|nr:DUF2868 domain-containing protein [Planctobacterium marinum]MCC2604669.1 DUF2868 domain-containing protein [Planctobacterium marinum]